jgi:hypothetical protein
VPVDDGVDDLGVLFADADDEPPPQAARNKAPSTRTAVTEIFLVRMKAVGHSNLCGSSRELEPGL